MDALDTLLTSFYLALNWQPYTWFGLLVLVNVMDALTTIKALQLGGRELNPALAHIMRMIGVVPALAIMKGAMLYFAFSSLQLIILYMPLLVAFYVAAVCWNLYQIAKLKRKVVT